MSATLVEASSVDGAGSWQLGKELSEGLFEGGRSRTRLTRRQKCQGRREHEAKEAVVEVTSPAPVIDILEISAAELRAHQEADPTLTAAREASGTVEGKGNGDRVSRYYRRNGLLYHQAPAGNGNEVEGVEQLVLPRQCRKTVLTTAHSIPLAGHLGKRKTADRILQRFYWPGVHNDVVTFCKSCIECQKLGRQKVGRAPLVPLPVIQEPFTRIAMDIVGPLPRSSRGNRYVLVVCDYATRYPEAIAMRIVEAERVAEELVTQFSRVGVLKEILTDQGTNFTSQLLQELYRMLHVRHIRTSLYHPQTDGLVERFNQTLKTMLRKTAVDEGKDWNWLLPYVLFAYREVPQNSTGFSPFELLYGRSPRGPLDVLKETWEGKDKSPEIVVSHILAIQDRMETMKDLVSENLGKAQQQQKAWYDRNARHRELEVGCQVLVLLPSSTNKLLAQWQGPYKVLEKIGSVNYTIDMHDRRKRKRIVHVNMLREFYQPSDQTAVGYWCEEADSDGQEEEIPVWRDDSTLPKEPVFGEQLNQLQKEELAGVLAEFAAIFSNTPGRTQLAEHRIECGPARPIRLPPYRILHAYRAAVQQEIKEMLEGGIIEPSSSEWFSPMVIMKKKDGALRVCVDYWKLNGISQADAYPTPRIDDVLEPAWETTVHHNHGPHKGLLAGSSGTASSPHDRILYSMWIVPVYNDAIRTARSSTHVPATDG